MGLVKGAVGCAVVALLAGHGLSTLDPGRRAALWNGMRGAVAPGGGAPSSGAPGATGAARPGPGGTAAVAAPAPRPVPRAEPVGAFGSSGEEWVAPDPLGQFRTTVEVDGRRLPVLVDTGATFVALSAEDADAVGLHPAPSDFRYAVETANGPARVAKVQLGSVRLGGIELRDVPALVAGRGQLGQTLLGMSFLSRLSTVRIDRGRLVLAR